jgi:hypothetical protein
MMKSRKVRWAGNAERGVKRAGEYRVLVRKHEGKRRYGKLGRKREDNINRHLKGMG